MDVIRDQSEADLLRGAQETLRSILSRTKQPLLLLLSNGPALAMLPESITIPAAQRLTIGLLDERFGVEPSEMNCAQLTGTDFYRSAIDAGARRLDGRPRDHEQIDIFASRIERVLRTWHDEQPGGAIVATQNIGADGHIASILPFPTNAPRFRELFDDNNRWVVGYDTSHESAAPPNSHSQRVTVTLTFLREYVDASIVLAAGTALRTAVERTLAPDGTLNETPARIIREMRGVRLFTTTAL